MPVLIVSSGGTRPGGVTSHTVDLQWRLEKVGLRCRILSPMGFCRTYVTAGGRIAGETFHFQASAPRSTRALALYLLLGYARLRGGRVILTLHHGNLASVYSQSRWNSFALRRLLGVVHVFVALTEEIEQYVRIQDPGLHVARSGSLVREPDIDSSFADAPPSASRVHWTDPRGEVVWVVSSGYEQELYDYEGLVAALALQSSAEFGLTLFTYGPVNQAYRSLVLQCAEIHRVPLRWLHGLNRQDFIHLLPTFSIYVRNTRSDSFGLAVAEALAAGLPVVATNVCPRPDGVLLIQHGDRDALAQMIALGLSGQAPSQEYRQSVKELADLNFAAVLGTYRAR